MTPRSLLILLVITAICVVGAGWAWWSASEGTALPAATGAVMFPSLAKADPAVATVEIQSRSYTLKLARQGTGWVAADRGDYPVLGTSADRLITDVTGLTVREAKTRDPKKYLAVGVDNPGAEARSVLVRLSDPSGTVLAELLVGKPADSVGADPRGATFVRRPSDPQTWLVEGRVNVPVSLGDWLEPLLHVPGPDMRSVRIEVSGKTVFEASRQEGESQFHLVSVDPTIGSADLVANDTAVKNMAQALVSADFFDVQPESEVTFADNARTIVLGTTDGTQYQLRLGQADGENWIAVHVETPVGSPVAGVAEVLNAKLAGWAYQLADPKMQALATDLPKLLQPPGSPALPGGPIDVPSPLDAPPPGIGTDVPQALPPP